MAEPPTKRRLIHHVEDLRAASRLATEATQRVCDIVQAMHETIAGGPAGLGRPLQHPTRAVNAVTYGSIRTVAQLVGESIDGALSQITSLLDPGERPSRSAKADAVLSVLNGVLGDHLQATSNALALPMQLRREGAPLDLEPRALLDAVPEASRKLLILVHGSCQSDRCWLRNGHDHGAALSRDLGYTPIYVHYNTGLHISTNGQRLAALLERLVAAWPVPVDEIAVLAHSMGGLVSRSSCHAAEERGYLWRKKLRSMVFLGTPHHGSPLERGGNGIEQLLGISRYSAPLARLGKIRSAGVTDMRHGNLLDQDWQGQDRFAHGADRRTPVPLPLDVACYAIAANRGSQGEKLSGDGLVPVDSALGRHQRAERRLAFPEEHQWVGLGMRHLDLLSHPGVYAMILRWLA